MRQTTAIPIVARGVGRVSDTQGSPAPDDWWHMVLWEPRPRGDWTGKANSLVPNRREDSAPTLGLT